MAHRVFYKEYLRATGGLLMIIGARFKGFLHALVDGDVRDGTPFQGACGVIPENSFEYIQPDVKPEQVDCPECQAALKDPVLSSRITRFAE